MAERPVLRMTARITATLFLLLLPLLLGSIDTARTAPERRTRRGDGLWPLPRAEERPTPLGFGLFVTPDPAENPIDPPERFTGYHAALDFELLPGEENADVPVVTICAGQVAFSGHANGYGGLLVQHCILGGQDVTILYGHLTLAGLPRYGSVLERGQRIALLADARSYESGWNRKHLHLGIRKGRGLDLKGYVQDQKELAQYLDPADVLPL